MLPRLVFRIWFIALLTILFVLWPAIGAAQFETSAPASDSPWDVGASLTAGFGQILELLEKRSFSLLEAWSEMRRSPEPASFEARYPAISGELDAWAAAVQERLGAGEPVDLTFVVETFGPLILDKSASEIRRDNALATICAACVQDELLCEAGALHRLLSTVLAEDPSALRKSEALRWWRRSGGIIDEGLLESVLVSEAGTDLELRTEIAKALFSIGTTRSLAAQRLLSGTDGLPEDPSGSQAQIACTAIRHFAREGYADAIPDVIDALQDPSSEVRRCAVESLSVMSGEDFGQGEEAVTRWRDWWRRREGTGGQ
jgi:hypothetical protein